MTRLEYDWWALNADRDDPRVAEIMMKTEPNGYQELELEELRGRTESAFVGGLLVAGCVPRALLGVRLEPNHFRRQAMAAAWAEIRNHDGDDGFDRLEIERGLAESGKMSLLAAGTILASTLDNAALAPDLPKYARRIIEGSVRASASRKAKA